MRNLILSFCTLLCFSFGHAQSLAPEVLASGGDYFTSAGIKLNWTLGETMIETYSSTGNFLTQGFQQPTIQIVNVAEIAKNSNQITAFPNPCSNQLNINTGKLLNLNITLQDVLGKILYNSINTERNFKLDFSSFNEGIYFINFYDENQLMKTMKIQKINF